MNSVSSRVGQPSRKSYGPTIDIEIARRSVREDLSPTERHVLSAFLPFMGSDGIAVVGISGIARVTGLNDATIIPARARLAQLGIIVVVRAPSTTTPAAYRVDLDAMTQPAEKRAKQAKGQWQQPMNPNGRNRRPISRGRRADIMARDKGLCRYCRAPAFVIDHIVPRAMGGSNAADNLAMSCSSCNTSKGPRTPEQAGMTLLEVPR